MRASNVSKTMSNNDKNQPWRDLVGDGLTLALGYELEERESQLRNLLARIHCDGGHYTEQHGIAKSVEDADKRLVKNSIALDVEKDKAAEAAAELQTLRQQFADERDLRITQLAAISTATLQNTESSRKDRIDDSNPYWSAAYGDTCRAIDREMELRQQIEELRSKLANLLCRIHRDGGHYLQMHGLEKAWSDADEIVSDLLHQRDQLQSDKRELVEGVQALMDSARPTEKEHPRMFSAWQNAAALIAKHGGGR